MQDKIKAITAREIIDSRGNPTVEATVHLSSGAYGTASVPSGASKGKREAWESRDNDPHRFKGRGVLSAIKAVREDIADALVGLSFEDPKEADLIMIALDGSKNKSRLGANATLSVSLALVRATAMSKGLPLYKYLSKDQRYRIPTPMFNILNGGVHSSNNIDIQEFMIVPYRLKYDDALRAGVEIYHTLGEQLIKRGLPTSVGDEGGFAPDLPSDREAIELICEAIEKSGYSTSDVGIALDLASSEWYTKGSYLLPKKEISLSSPALLDYLAELCQSYPIISIEDGMAEDDQEGWRAMTERLSKKIMLVGDDLFVTNKEQLTNGISKGIANSILIKPNQIGTISEVVEVIEAADNAFYGTVLSHRSGETTDSSISDIAVAMKASFIKAGAPCRGERVAKYNRLSQIYEELSREVGL